MTKKNIYWTLTSTIEVTLGSFLNIKNILFLELTFTQHEQQKNPNALIDTKSLMQTKECVLLVFIKQSWNNILIYILVHVPMPITHAL